MEEDVVVGEEEAAGDSVEDVVEDVAVAGSEDHQDEDVVVLEEAVEEDSADAEEALVDAGEAEEGEEDVNKANVPKGSTSNTSLVLCFCFVIIYIYSLLVLLLIAFRLVVVCHFLCSYYSCLLTKSFS